nr:ATPase, F1 complex, beta subunit [Ipomoea batatas]
MVFAFLLLFDTVVQWCLWFPCCALATPNVVLFTRVCHLRRACGKMAHISIVRLVAMSDLRLTAGYGAATFHHRALICQVMLALNRSVTGGWFLGTLRISRLNLQGNSCLSGPPPHHLGLSRTFHRRLLSVRWVSCLKGSGGDSPLGSATTNCFSIRLPKARDIAKTPPTLQVPNEILQNIINSIQRYEYTTLKLIY